ncbi:MAG: prepilin-type N-terminal cleavage/methylation domain-containing protein [Sedimentisphaerales bacterium]|nr:prepilin-type N-terminal cleavage/methylation domain-containing protein [Sedimentisphaerales bacterium]
MHTKKGFTLIELLVVVSIIALLVSILLPALNKAREQAKAVVCLSTIKSFATANEVYSASYNGYYVPSSQTPLDPAQWWGMRWPEVTQFREIIAMQKSEDLWEDAYMFPEGLRCPSHKYIDDDAYLEQMRDTFQSADGRYAWQISYGYNVEYWTHKNFEILGNGGFPDRNQIYAFKASSIRSASEKLQWIDAISYSAQYAWADYRSSADGGNSLWYQFGDDVVQAGLLSQGFPGWKPWNVRFYTTYRHSNSANVAFFDGHGEKLDDEEVYDVDNPGYLYNLDNRNQNPLWDVKWPVAE